MHPDATKRQGEAPFFAKGADPDSGGGGRIIQNGNGVAVMMGVGVPAIAQRGMVPVIDNPYADRQAHQAQQSANERESAESPVRRRNRLNAFPDLCRAPVEGVRMAKVKAYAVVTCATDRMLAAPLILRPGQE